MLSDVCKGRNYTFTSNAPGYIPQTVPGVDGNLDVTLERIGKCISCNLDVTLERIGKCISCNLDVTLERIG